MFPLLEWICRVLFRYRCGINFELTDVKNTKLQVIMHYSLLKKFSSFLSICLLTVLRFALMFSSSMKGLKNTWKSIKNFEALEAANEKPEKYFSIHFSRFFFFWKNEQLDSFMFEVFCFFMFFFANYIT